MLKNSFDLVLVLFPKKQKIKHILLIYEYMFGIMLMDTFEKYQMLSLSIFYNTEGWWLIMTKREISQFIIILLLFFIVITLLFR